MAYINMSMRSQALGMDTGVSVLLPERRDGQRDAREPERKHPVLYCLHGHGDDHTAWIRKSSIETLSRSYDVIVVMPEVQRGWYADAGAGRAYRTWVAEELPIKVQNFFHASARREDTFVMGNSMGGYGALSIAMANPERYAAAVGLSPALPQSFEEYSNDFTDGIHQTFGPKEAFEASSSNIFNLLDQLDTYEGNRPRLVSCCGDQDWISTKGCGWLRDYVNRRCTHLDFTFVGGHGGHDWTYWNPLIGRALTFFGLRPYSTGTAGADDATALGTASPQH